jgi:hypothetical protein
MLTRSPHVSFAERVAEMVGPRIRDVFRLRSGKVMAPFTDDAIRKYLARERRKDVARLEAMNPFAMANESYSEAHRQATETAIGHPEADPAWRARRDAELTRAGVRAIFATEDDPHQSVSHAAARSVLIREAPRKFRQVCQLGPAYMEAFVAAHAEIVEQEYARRHRDAADCEGIGHHGGL